MLETSRRRLIALFTAVTSLIMAGLVIFSCAFAVRQIRQQEEDTLATHRDAVAYRLKNSSFIQASWLSELEASNHLVISVSDNGLPFSFTGAWLGEELREELVAQVARRAQADGVDPEAVAFRNGGLWTEDVISPVYMEEARDGKRFLGQSCIFGMQDHYIGLVILKHFPDEREELLHLLFLFAAAWILSCAALFFLSRFLVGAALRPAEESERRQREFIAAASHELRSPLAVIKANASALLGETADPKRFVPRIGQECDRMSRLVGDMLLLTSSGSKTWSAKMELLDLDTLLLDLYEAYEPLCQEKGRRLALELPDGILPQICGDQERFTQILTALLNNALTYAPEGSTVLLRASTGRKKGKAGMVFIEVADCGPGIPDGEKRKVFERFYRADRSRTDKSHFGLGLSIAKELAALHKGSLSVKDTPGGGATFVVEVPAAHSPARKG